MLRAARPRSAERPDFGVSSGWAEDAARRPAARSKRTPRSCGSCAVVGSGAGARWTDRSLLLDFSFDSFIASRCTEPTPSSPARSRRVLLFAKLGPPASMRACVRAAALRRTHDARALRRAPRRFIQDLLVLERRTVDSNLEQGIGDGRSSPDSAKRQHCTDDHALRMGTPTPPAGLGLVMWANQPWPCTAGTSSSRTAQRAACRACLWSLRASCEL